MDLLVRDVYIADFRFVWFRFGEKKVRWSMGGIHTVRLQTIRLHGDR